MTHAVNMSHHMAEQAVAGLDDPKLESWFGGMAGGREGLVECKARLQAALAQLHARGGEASDPEVT